MLSRDGCDHGRQGWNHSFKHVMVFLAATPVTFKKELESQEANEGDEATLSCETSSTDCKVTWLKGSTVLTHGDKYSMEQRATSHTLTICRLNVKDSGEYTCDTGDKRSSATVTVKGNKVSSSSSYLKFTSLTSHGQVLNQFFTASCSAGKNIELCDV